MNLNLSSQKGKFWVLAGTFLVFGAPSLPKAGAQIPASLRNPGSLNDLVGKATDKALITSMTGSMIVDRALAKVEGYPAGWDKNLLLLANRTSQRSLLERYKDLGSVADSDVENLKLVGTFGKKEYVRNVINKNMREFESEAIKMRTNLNRMRVNSKYLDKDQISNVLEAYLVTISGFYGYRDGILKNSSLPPDLKNQVNRFSILD
jgi:hypothetical protein